MRKNPHEIKCSYVLYRRSDSQGFANATKIIFKTIPLDIYLLKDNECPKSGNMNKIRGNQNSDNKHLDIGERYL